MRKLIYISIAVTVVALLLIFSLSTIHSEGKKTSERSVPVGDVVEQRRMSNTANSQQPVTVSIIQLIANPAAYDGKYVRIIGFVRIEFEGTAVYLHQEDYKAAISKNALWLSIDGSDRQAYAQGHQKYVLIEGIFDAKDTGHRGLFSGAIREIKRFQVWAG